MSSTQTASRGPGYATPLQAMKGPREKLLYVSLVSYDITKPDALATIDVSADSANCGKVIHVLKMPHVGDELHHYGWNICSSCCGDSSKVRRFLILPGQISSRIYIVDTGDEREPRIHKVIEPNEILGKLDLSAPHTVHCLPNGHIMISMLGNGKMEAPGGFLLLDQEFNIAGRWSSHETKMRFNHDFWYQPALNVMVTSEFSAPKTYAPGLKLSDMGEGKYGNGLCFWNWKEKTLIKRVELGDDGIVTLSARFLHDPKSTHGYVVSMSGSIWHWYRDDTQTWQVEKVVQIKGLEASGWPIPVPSFCSDMVISLDDRFIYVSNWFNGDILQYDITTRGKPLLVGQVWCGASYTQTGKVRAKRAEFHDLQAGPHMMQLSLDGKRLYVTNSFLSTWDDQFYPKLGAKGSAMIRIDCDTNKGGIEIDETFFVDFGSLVDFGGKYRAHEMRYPGGDCTSDIWLDEHARHSTSG